MNILSTLLEISVYSAVIFAALMLFKKLNRGKLSPVLSFMLWFILLARLCIPVTLESGLSVFVIPDSAPAAAEKQSGPKPGMAEVQTAGQSYAQNAQIQSPAPSGQPAQSKNSGVAPVATTVDIKPHTLLISVWLTGVALIMAHTAQGAIRLRRVARKKSVSADTRIHRIYAKCLSEFGIGKALPLRVTEEIASPALTALFRPAILLPLNFVEKASDTELMFTLKHELTHYRRKDHLICMLMRALEAIYWFNPAVWLAAKQMLLDMESACDSMVVSNMANDEKTHYANTVLDMFSGERRPRFAVGMALQSTKDVAERRIRGIFMKQKTKIRIKTGALLLAAVLFIACFTTACQPVTQDEAAKYAVAEDTEEMEVVDVQEPVNEAAAPETGGDVPQQAANERYTGEKKINDVTTLTYDAEVIAPDKVPTATLSIRDFTSDDVKAFADYFMAGREHYQPWPQDKAALTAELDWLKADLERIQNENAEFEADTEAFEEGKRISESPEENYGIDSSNPNSQRYQKYRSNEPVVKNYEYYIGKIEEELDSAPGETVKEPATYEFADENIGNVGGVESGQETLMEEDMIINQAKVWADNPNGGVSEILSINRSADGWMKAVGGSIFYTRDTYLGMSGEDYAGRLKDRSELTLPEEEAVKLATDAVNALVPGMELQSVAMMEDYPIDENGRFDYFSGEMVPSYYDLNFTRVVEGVPITFDKYGMNEYLDEDMESSIISESVQVIVDNNGISSFSWNSPYTDIAITEPGAQVVPMDQAMAAFEQQLADRFNSAWFMDPANESSHPDSIDINVNRIQLGLTRMSDGNGGHKLIPTWDFFCSAMATNDSEEQTLNLFGPGGPDESFGTVNALTGETMYRTGAWEGNSW